MHHPPPDNSSHSGLCFYLAVLPPVALHLRLLQVHPPRVLVNFNVSDKHGNFNINFGLLNMCSLTAEGHHIQDLLSDWKSDFLCLTKMCQQPNDLVSLSDST
ncbi:hypothetical protein CHARACLAT_015169 [Characodon lateralis]|uniref:Uncharacterized protein n=1 Tax=Characodon lateralis TaxID=208331 RepID=A0ABU7CP43_9TELE|nr:hypothetical protein [Characodon lateralis]